MAKGQQRIFAGVDAAGNRVADNSTPSRTRLQRARPRALVHSIGMGHEVGEENAWAAACGLAGG
eukprot:4409221-Prymnesium_polylepis.1